MVEVGILSVSSALSLVPVGVVLDSGLVMDAGWLLVPLELVLEVGSLCFLLRLWLRLMLGFEVGVGLMDFF